MLILKNIDVIIIKDQDDNVKMQRYDNSDYLLRSLCLLKLGEGEAALQDVQMAINAGYPKENRFRLLSYHVDNVHDGGEDNHSDDPISYTRQKIICEIWTKIQKRWMAQKYRKSHKRWKKCKSHKQ